IPNRNGMFNGLPNLKPGYAPIKVRANESCNNLFAIIKGIAGSIESPDLYVLITPFSSGTVIFLEKKAFTLNNKSFTEVTSFNCPNLLACLNSILIASHGNL